jgi:beta-mannanase
MASDGDKGPWFGFYLPLRDTSSYLKKVSKYSRIFKKNVRILSFYAAWGNETEPDLPGMEMVLHQGLIPMLTWEPWRLPQGQPISCLPGEQPDFSLDEILKGRYDDYIHQWAIALKTVSGPVLFRPMHEMNGDWYPWCGSVNGNDPGKYVEAWVYLRSFFKEARNDRLRWVWSPYVHSVPEKTGNEIWQYYPGEGEVDVLALDGYNWGGSQPWSLWKSFDEVFSEGYEVLNQIAPEKPMMIGEMGCAEEGGDKGKWMVEAFDLLKSKFNRISGLIWFNMDKECDWRIESSIHSFRSFRKGLRRWHSLN